MLQMASWILHRFAVRTLFGKVRKEEAQKLIGVLSWKQGSMMIRSKAMLTESQNLLRKAQLG